jgi:hypothetical protein
MTPTEPLNTPAVPLSKLFRICMTLSPTRVDPPAEPALGKPHSRWGQGGLEPLVQPARAGRSSVHRAQHLDVTGVEAEVGTSPQRP